MAPSDIEEEILSEIATVHTATKQLLTEKEILDFAGDAHGLILTDVEPITRYVIENMPNLKVVARYGIGVDNIDVKAATDKGIMVVNTPDANIEEVADHTIALILALTRKIIKMDKRVREGRWRTDYERDIKPIHACYAQVLGILGFGKIGKRVAIRGKALGFKVIAYDPHVPRWDFDLLKVECVESLNELLKRSDVLSIHMPLTDETRHMIGEREIRMMKPTAYIINTARGAIIDQDALYKALKEGRIAGAGLDVFEIEPPKPDNPLFELDNVILSPHLAGYSEESRRRTKIDAATGVADALRGRIPKFLVNPEVLRKS